VRIGGGEIRTHERLSPLPVFKTGAFNHSATPPDDHQELHKLEQGVASKQFKIFSFKKLEEIASF